MVQPPEGRSRRMCSSIQELPSHVGLCPYGLVAAGTIGARAVIVQAVDERAKAFHIRFGYRPFSDREPLMMILRMTEIEWLLHA